MLKYEDLIAEIRQRPLEERVSLLGVLADSIKQEIGNEPNSQPKTGAKFIKISDFDPNWRPTQEETAQNEAWLAGSQEIAEKIGQSWPHTTSSVDAIREDRREL